MKRKALVPLSSKDYTHAYCREWMAAELEHRPQRPKLFLLFPTLEESIRGKRTLEIGCGRGGGYLKLFTNAGAFATGIDLFEEPILSNMVRGDFMTSPFLTGTYDFIFAFGVFEECALYSPAGLRYDQFKTDMQMKHTPEKLLARLGQLLARGGQCLFQTYVDQLIFTKEMAADAGFKLVKYVKELNTQKYGSGGEKCGVTLRPSTYYRMSRT